MKIAVISDIHGNMEALKQVLSDIDGRNIHEIHCLGDTIGYGPEPEEVVGTIRERRIPCVMGNHEWAAVNPAHLEWFNPVARRSLEKSIGFLSGESLNFIRNLPAFRVAHNCRFVHGFPPDSVNTYLFQVSETMLLEAFRKMEERICFVGHTHDLELIEFDGKNVYATPLRRGIQYLDPERKYIINIGSVGQPRDMNNNAKYVVFDTDHDVVDICYIPYDIESVARKIIDLGLPEGHAARLR